MADGTDWSGNKSATEERAGAPERLQAIPLPDGSRDCFEGERQIAGVSRPAGPAAPTNDPKLEGRQETREQASRGATSGLKWVARPASAGTFRSLIARTPNEGDGAAMRVWPPSFASRRPERAFQERSAHRAAQLRS